MNNGSHVNRSSGFYSVLDKASDIFVQKWLNRDILRSQSPLFMFQDYIQALIHQLQSSPQHQEFLISVLQTIQQDEELLAAFSSQKIDASWLTLAQDAQDKVSALATVVADGEVKIGQSETDEFTGYTPSNLETLYLSQTAYETLSPQSPQNSFSEAQATVALGPESLSEASVSPVREKSPDHVVEMVDYIGRYVDLGPLGMGAMGEVRLVRDEQLNRKLAMKIIHPKFLKSRNAMSRFVEEAQIGAQLQYPNIVPVHELGRLPDGRLYFTMKQIKGTEFSSLIDDVHEAFLNPNHSTVDGQVTFRRLIQIFHTICETMAFAHSLGVVHRDLKPDNVMVGDFGEVLVVDWGVAKVLGHDRVEVEEIIHTDRTEQSAMATRMGAVTGTPIYMSPEQAMGRIDLVGTHSDVYTLGAI